MKSSQPVHDKRRDSPLVADFIDPEEGREYRYAYAEEHLNSWIALQIKAIREQRGLRQSELAQLIGTKQPAIARLENANYSRWKTETLKKIARALDVRLRISFETFGSLIDEDETFNRKVLERPRFEDDPVFSEPHSHVATDSDCFAPAGLQIVPSTDARSVQKTLPFDVPVAVNNESIVQGTRRRPPKPQNTKKGKRYVRRIAAGDRPA